MARNKLTTRVNFNHRRANYQQRRVRSGVKSIEGRIRNRDIKINRSFPNPKTLKLKKWTNC